MTAITRFAPSPTGFLHLGNARVALVNWLFARRHGGSFILRLDDTDAGRSGADYAAAIERDLRWLGLAWDRFARQSERLEPYQAAFDRLHGAGRIYPCYETPDELEYKRRRQLARNSPPIYDRAGLALDEAARRKLEAEGRRPHWRFRLEHAGIEWEDLVRGPVHFHGANLSDPVVRRADGTWLYMLPSVVDDVDLAVSHVIRGEDHVANTPVQIQMFEALGAEVPAFAHLPLMTDLGGKGLSKRFGSLTLESLRADGIEAMAVNSLLAALGSSDSIEVRRGLADLVAHFDLAHLGRAAPKFDPGQLQALNARLIHAMPYEEAMPRLASCGLGGAGRAFWEAVRPNLGRLADAADWYRVCFEAIAPVVEDREFARIAAAALPPEPWDGATWQMWTEVVKAATGRRGGELFRPLRLALTGRDRGPEMKVLLPLIGRARVLARLEGDPARPLTAAERPT